MASPFSVFRKNQKMWMAGITIMALIAFVFLSGPVKNSFTGPGGRDEPVVRTTKFGNITGGQLQMLTQNRAIFVEFLQTLARSDNKQVASNASRVLQAIGNATFENVVNKWLFAREAEAMGITVDEASIRSFTAELTTGSLGSDDIVKILKGIRQGVSAGHLPFDFARRTARLALSAAVSPDRGQ